MKLLVLFGVLALLCTAFADLPAAVQENEAVQAKPTPVVTPKEADDDDAFLMTVTPKPENSETLVDQESVEHVPEALPSTQPDTPKEPKQADDDDDAFIQVTPEGNAIPAQADDDDDAMMSPVEEQDSQPKEQRPILTSARFREILSGDNDAVVANNNASAPVNGSVDVAKEMREKASAARIKADQLAAAAKKANEEAIQYESEVGRVEKARLKALATLKAAKSAAMAKAASAAQEAANKEMEKANAEQKKADDQMKKAAQARAAGNAVAAAKAKAAAEAQLKAAQDALKKADVEAKSAAKWKAKAKLKSVDLAKAAAVKARANAAKMAEICKKANEEAEKAEKNAEEIAKKELPVPPKAPTAERKAGFLKALFGGSSDDKASSSSSSLDSNEQKAVQEALKESSDKQASAGIQQASAAPQPSLEVPPQAVPQGAPVQPSQ